MKVLQMSDCPSSSPRLSVFVVYFGVAAACGSSGESTQGQMLELFLTPLAWLFGRFEKDTPCRMCSVCMVLYGVRTCAFILRLCRSAASRKWARCDPLDSACCCS